MRHSIKRALALALSVLLATGNPGFTAFAEGLAPGQEGAVLVEEGGPLAPEGRAGRPADGQAEGPVEVLPEQPAEGQAEGPLAVEVVQEPVAEAQGEAASASDVAPEGTEAGQATSERSATVDDVVLTAADDNTGAIALSTALLINGANKSAYEGRTITGTVPSDQETGIISDVHFDGAVVVDGIELNLTVDGLNADYSERNATVSGISLVNGATLHLTVRGENTLKAGYGGAGISVPAGCTLEITSASTGTLNATGGRNFGGGAGIGSIGNGNNTRYYMLYYRSLGSIIVNGATINAQGGTWYSYDTPASGAAGIGGSEEGDGTGSITINGGTVTATGGYSAAGIGGGNVGTIQSITINGGTVTANSNHGSSAIGTGFNADTSGNGTLDGPTVKITGGMVTANGNIGFGDAHVESQNVGGSVWIGSDAIVICTGSISAPSVDWEDARKVRFDANGGSGTMPDVTLQAEESYTLPGCGFDPPAGKYFAAWDVNGTTVAPGESVAVRGGVSAKAMWEDYVTVSFVDNGGYGSMQDVTVKKGAYTLPGCGFDPPAGKYFAAWDVNGTTVAAGKNVAVSGSVSAKAMWEDYVTVSFEANGGSGSMQGATVKKGAYTLPGCGFDPPAGKYFAAWDVNGTTVAAGKNVAVSGSVSAKAMWEDYVTVSFDANDGTGSMEPMTLRKGRHGLPDCDFVPPEGKRFSYWTIKDNVGARLDASKPKFEVWDNVVLEANWVPANWGEDVTIAYGSATVNESVTVERNVTWTIEEGCTLTVNNTIDVQDGYSLTVTGGGTLIVQGTNGKEGMPGTPGHDGLPAIRGTVVVLGGNVNLSGGAGGKGKDGVNGSQTGSNGGDGGAGVDGNLTVHGGNVSVTGGTGGTGGAHYGQYSHGGGGHAKDGADGQAVTGAVNYDSSEDASALQSSTGEENAWDGLERGAACTVRYLRCTVPLAVTFDPGAANGVEGDMAPQVFCYDTARPLLPAAYTRESYDFTGWNTKADGTGVTYLNEQSISITGNVTLYAQWAPDPAHFSVNQARTEYTIHTAGGWGVFCDALQDNETYNRFSGKTVKLGEDITVTRMAGGENHDFCGTFDGNGKTLTFNYGGADSYRNEQCIAPFRYVSNVDSAAAAIRDLRVAGDVYTSAKYAAGLVSRCWGTVSIENCRSSVSIHSSVSGDGTHAGFVAENNCSSLSITGCVFDGKLLTTGGTTSCGGFVGYGGGAKVSIRDSLYAPDALGAGETEVLASESATFNRTAPTITNCYYTRKLGAAQGKAARGVTAGEYVTVKVALAGDATSYSVSGITAYGDGGLSRDGDLYYGNGDEVGLALGHDRDGYDLIGYTASAGKLSGNDADGYALTMPDANVTVSATFMAADQPFYAWVYGHSLTLEGTIGVNAYLILGNDIKANPSNYEVEFWKGDALASATKVSEGRERTEGDFDLRGFTVTAAAKEMDVSFTMKIRGPDGAYVDFADCGGEFVAGDVGLSYSVNDYLKDMISYSEDLKMVKLAKDMQAYGTYARHYFGKRDVSGWSEGLPTVDDFQLVQADDLSKFVPTLPQPEIDHFRYVGSTLVLEDETRFRLYFVTDDKDQLEASYRVSGKESTAINLEIKQGTGGFSKYHYVEVSNIVAKQLGEMYDFTFTNKDGQTVTAHHGPYAYVRWAVGASGEDDDAKNLRYVASALYRYGESAQAYFDSGSEEED